MAKDKTSKTARVMGLLSKKQETPPPEEQVAAPAQHAAPVPPIITSLAPDAAVSVQIKSALEEALENELNGTSTASPAPEAVPSEPAPASEPEPEPAPMAEPDLAAVQPAPKPSVPSVPTEPQPEPVQSIPVQAVPVQPVIVQEPVEKHLGYINVMQVLVSEKAPKYAEMFGLCTCKRCLEDVEALALNHLPPKYVVMSENERIPKLTFYEGQYSSDITAQLLNACKVVMQTPHHTRIDNQNT